MSSALARAPGNWRPLAAVLGYAALVAVLGAIAFGAVSQLMERQTAIAEARDMLDRLEGRKPLNAAARAGIEDHAGSPFLEGPSLTVAGAVLMQRVSSAVEQADGHITSSRVELEAAAFGPDFVAVTATLDLPAAELQNLLFDLEAGQPFLFVGQLVVQGQGDAAETTKAPMRVTLTVYGRWQGAP